MTYRVPWNVAQLLLSPKVEPERRDELWRHTCLELFVRPLDASEYLEFNFGTSTEWASYHFDAYRRGMTDAGIEPTKIVSTRNHVRFELSALIELPAWEELPLEVNISVILEEVDGRKSYWALAHPPGPPDFHHPDCFAFELPAPDGA